MSFFKRAAAGLVGSVVGQAILVSVGGAGVVVSSIAAFLTDASLPAIIAVGVSTALFFLGAHAAYLHANPNERRWESRREKIERWRACLDEARGKPFGLERHGLKIAFNETSEYAELGPLLTCAEREEYEKTYDELVLYRAIARLEREWGLV